MSVTPAMHKSVRKAMESVLNEAMKADAGAGLSAIEIQWPNINFERQGKPEYVRFSYHPTVERAMTMGENPRVQVDGFAKIGCFVAAGRGEDPLDIVAERVRAAYEYGLDLTRDGFTAQITRRNRGSAFPTEDGWFYLPVDIYWNLWRAT